MIYVAKRKIMFYITLRIRVNAERMNGSRRLGLVGHDIVITESSLVKSGF